jgi:AbiV family abortive infection protein
VTAASKVDVIGVVLNATRLAEDARLLTDHERYASAYALAILSFEEIGKMLIKLWGLPGSKGHISKQRAVASLLMAEGVVKKFGPLRDMEREELVRVANAVSESDAGQLAQIVETTFIDKAKQFALYHHDGPKESSFQAGITSEYIEAMLGTARAAAKIANESPQAVEAGSYIFQALEAVAAEEKRQRKANRA